MEESPVNHSPVFFWCLSAFRGFFFSRFVFFLNYDTKTHSETKVVPSISKFQPTIIEKAEFFFIPFLPIHQTGGIPVATLNLQQGPHSLWQVPDSWHHQMIYGVSPQGKLCQSFIRF